jgi:hypothetical protein
VRLLNQNPNEYLVQRSGRSHLTVIRTHIFLNHLLSSVASDHKVQEGDRQPLFWASVLSQMNTNHLVQSTKHKVQSTKLMALPVRRSRRLATCARHQRSNLTRDSHRYRKALSLRSCLVQANRSCHHDSNCRRR